ncbi:GNAT family N-acetyltransferase [Streptomyces sp. NPDC005004]
MDATAVLAAYDRQMREGARAEGPGVRIERTGAVVRLVSEPGGWNAVLWSGLDETDAPRAIEEQIAHFTGLGQEFEWKLYGHDRPRDLGDRLTAAGFRAEEEETVMVAETADVAQDAEPPAGVRVVRATDEVGVELVVRVHEEVFGRDGSRLRRQLLTQLADDPGTVLAVVALAGDEPVSAARLEIVPGTEFAGLWGGGTVTRWRGRGVYRTLVAHRARAAAAHGCRYLQVDASDMSRPVLERLGFRALTTTTPYLYGA